MKNVGKVFENDFKQSVPQEYCLLHRLPDPPQSFKRSKDTKFSHKNPCDFHMFDSLNRIFYCFELKSTKSNFISFEDISVDEPKQKMIHKHQILGLQKYGQYDYTVAGFICNFRDEKRNEERTYFLHIDNFMQLYRTIGKWSFNELDLLTYGGMRIKGNKKRVHYKWDINEFLERWKKKYD